MNGDDVASSPTNSRFQDASIPVMVCWRTEPVPTLHIKLLGEFRLIYDKKLVPDVDKSRLQSLLTYLLLHRTAPQSRQHLAFLFWPDSAETQARSNLRRELYNLRRALPHADQYLSIDTRTIGWRSDAPFILDVADFEALLAQADEGLETDRQIVLEQAVALYTGQLLPGCYEEWLLSERERLEQLFIEALEQLLVRLADQGAYSNAIGYGRRLLRHDPLHERTYCRLIDLYAQRGDRARALRMYHDCVTVLERELGVETGQEIQEAYFRLTHQKALSATPDRPATPRQQRLDLHSRCWPYTG